MQHESETHSIVESVAVLSIILSVQFGSRGPRDDFKMKKNIISSALYKYNIILCRRLVVVQDLGDLDFSILMKVQNTIRNQKRQE